MHADRSLHLWTVWSALQLARCLLQTSYPADWLRPLFSTRSWKKGFLCITCLERKDLGGGQRKNTFVSTSFRYNFNSSWLQNSAGIQLSLMVPSILFILVWSTPNMHSHSCLILHMMLKWSQESKSVCKDLLTSSLCYQQLQACLRHLATLTATALYFMECCLQAHW